MKALIVDDSKFIRITLKKFLLKLGIENTKLSSGQNVLTDIGEFKPNIIFLDVLMPEVNGVEILRKISKVKNDAKIIMLSGMSHQVLIDQCLEIGADAYLVKPINQLKLEDVFQNLGIF